MFLLSKPGRVSQPTGLAGAPWHGEQRARHCRSMRERKGTQRKGSSGAIRPPLCGQTQAHACTPALGHVHSHRHVVHLLLVWLGLFVSGLFSFSPVNPGLITVAFSLATCLENLTDVPAPPSCHSLADSSVRTGKEGLETSDVPRPYHCSELCPLRQQLPPAGEAHPGEEPCSRHCPRPTTPQGWAAQASCGRSAFFRRNDSH